MRKLWSKRQKMKFSKVMVVLVLSQAFLYTWTHLMLSFFVGMEIAPTTSVAFYGFCGAEAGLLAWLKKLNEPTKQEKGDSDEEGTNYSETYEP